MRIAVANVILLAGWIAIAWVDRPISRLGVGSAAVAAAGAAVMLPATPLADSRSQRADPLQRPGNSRAPARSRRTTTRSSWRNV